MNSVNGLRALPTDQRMGYAEHVPESPEVAAENDAILAQAQSEGVTLPKDGTALDRRVSITVDDRQYAYRIADKVGLVPLMKFAHAASSGVDTGDMMALAAIYEMLQDCLDPREWDRFLREMTAAKADAEELLPIVQQTIELLTARPTRRDSGSYQPSGTTPGSSMGNSSTRPDGLVPVSDLGRVAFTG